MKRIVMDTNVLISAIGWKGSSYLIWDRSLQGSHQLLTSSALLAELDKVLARPKFSFIPTMERQQFLVLFTAITELIEIHIHLDVVKADPSDNRILECAVDGQADVIISGDHHLVNLKDYNGIPILTPQGFLRWIRMT